MPSAQISSAQLVGATAISARNIWAVGSQPTSGPSQAPLAEHFDGTSWRVVSTPSPTSTSRFESVAAAASDDVWAVGVGGTNNAIRSGIVVENRAKANTRRGVSPGHLLWFPRPTPGRKTLSHWRTLS
jgi:hypothetical protein